jgi:hypothetical protein
MKNHLPNSNTDAGTLEEWELQIMDLEERLRPIAQRQRREKGQRLLKPLATVPPFTALLLDG